MATVGKQFQCLIIIISFSLSLSIRVEKFNKAQAFPEFQREDNNGYGLYPQKDDNHLEPDPKQSPQLDKPDFAGLSPEEKNFLWNQYQIEKRQRKELINGEKPQDDPTLSSDWDDNWSEEDEEAQPEQAFDNWNQEKNYNNDKKSARYYKFGREEESSAQQQQWSTNKYEQPDEWGANNKHEPQREQLDGERWDRNRPQGMSDTRSAQGGKYHYDLNNNKYSSEHPYTQFYKAENYEQQP